MSGVRGCGGAKVLCGLDNFVAVMVRYAGRIRAYPIIKERDPAALGVGASMTVRVTTGWSLSSRVGWPPNFVHIK